MPPSRARSRKKQHTSKAPAAKRKALAAPSSGTRAYSICAGLAFLGGLGVGLLLAGLTQRFAETLSPSPFGAAVAGAGLFCLSVGHLIPLRLADWLRNRGPILRLAASGDLPLLWATLAVCSLAAGLLLVIMPTWISAIEHGFIRVERNFLWPTHLLGGVQLLLITLALLPVVLPLGIMQSCFHRLAAPGHTWDFGPSGWALVGAGAAAVASSWALEAGVPCRALALAASIPILIIALVAGWRSSALLVNGLPIESIVAFSVPDLRDHAPILTRVTTAWLALATAGTIVVWGGLYESFALMPGSVAGQGILLVLAGIGMILGLAVNAGRSPTTGSLGLACTLAGLAVAVGITIPAIGLGSPITVDRATVGFFAWGCFSSLVLGYALAYGQTTVLCRAGSKAATGTALLSLTLAVASGGAMLSSLANEEVRRGFSLLAALALSLAAVGGTVIIHEPEAVKNHRRLRLAAVAVCVATMIYALPKVGRRWSRQEASLPDPQAPSQLAAALPRGEILEAAE